MHFEKKCLLSIMESIINNTDDTIHFHLTCFPKADPAVLPKMRTLRPDTVVTISPQFTAEDYLLCDGDYIAIALWRDAEREAPNSWAFINSATNKIDLYSFADYKIDISGNIKENVVITVTKSDTNGGKNLDWVFYGIILLVVAAILAALIIKFRKN